MEAHDPLNLRPERPRSPEQPAERLLEEALRTQGTLRDLLVEVAALLERTRELSRDLEFRADRASKLSQADRPGAGPEEPAPPCAPPRVCG